MREQSKLYGTTPVDMRGTAFKVGDKVVKAYSIPGTIEIAEVTRVENGKVYLGTHVPLRYPSRVLIVTKLYEEPVIT